MRLLAAVRMGCGRSKHQSCDSSLADLRNQEKSKKKLSRQEKKAKIIEATESVQIEAICDEKEKMTFDETVTKKTEPETGVLRTRRPTPAHTNGMSHNIITNSKGTQELSIPNEQTLRVPTGGREKTGNGQGQYIRATSSQIEFFRKLDEKIERGLSLTESSSSEDENEKSARASFQFPH